MARGFRVSHVGRLEPHGAVSDVFFGRHMVRRELWDKEKGVQKPRPCDAGTVNKVNAALAIPHGLLHA